MSRGRVLRHVAGAGVAGLVSMALLNPVMAEDAPPPPTAVRLQGGGSNGLAPILPAWWTAMYGSPWPVDVSFIGQGTAASRENLIGGGAQFAFSGTPFTADELAALPEGEGSLIKVPLSVVSLSVLMTSPYDIGWGRFQAIPGCDPDTSIDPCDVEVPFEGPWKIPPESLSAMMLRLDNPSIFEKLGTYTAPEMIDALGVDDLRVQLGKPSAYPTWVHRAENTEENLFLQTYASQLGPKAWNFGSQRYPDPTAWLAPRENAVPGSLAAWRLSDALEHFVNYAQDATTVAGQPASWVNNMMAVPTTMVDQLIAENPGSHLTLATIQNKHGDWLTPTPEAVTAAVQDPANTQVAGVTTDVPGAYPLTWVENLYTVAGRLNPLEANALAGIVRYAVTDGQQAAIDARGVALTDALRSEALAAANEIVEKNCTLDGWQVVRAMSQPIEPQTPGVTAIGERSVCDLRPPDTTTSTSEAPATDPPAVSSSSSSSSSSTSSTSTPPSSTSSTSTTVRRQTTTTTRAPATTSTTSTPSTTSTTVVSVTSTTVPPVASSGPPSGGGGTRLRGRPLAALPMGAPSDGSEGFKKLGSLMLGAGLYLVVRRSVGKLIAKRAVS